MLRCFKAKQDMGFALCQLLADTLVMHSQHLQDAQRRTCSPGQERRSQAAVHIYTPRSAVEGALLLPRQKGFQSFGFRTRFSCFFLTFLVFLLSFSVGLSTRQCLAVSLGLFVG